MDIYNIKVWEDPGRGGLGFTVRDIRAQAKTILHYAKKFIHYAKKIVHEAL
jgi:hypothetical protein